MRYILLLICIFFKTSITYSQNIPGNEIFLFDFTIKNGQYLLSNPVNISNQKGYDNQPNFDARKHLIYYSSMNDEGNTDIKMYNYLSNERKIFSSANASEYSPTLTFDKKYISCIHVPDSNSQFLIKYPINGGDPIFLIKNLVIGYHAWLSENELILFVLGKENTLHYYRLDNRKDSTIIANIGRSLHKIPNENAFSFVHIISEKERVLKKVDLKTFKITTIINLFDEHEDITWSEDGMIFTNDGSKIFVCDPKKDLIWKPIQIKPEGLNMKGLTRMVISSKSKKMAVVMSE